MVAFQSMALQKSAGATTQPYLGYVPERPFPQKAVKKADNKKIPSIPPNSMIGQFTAVPKTTAVLKTAFLG